MPRFLYPTFRVGAHDLHRQPDLFKSPVPVFFLHKITGVGTANPYCLLASSICVRHVRQLPEIPEGVCCSAIVTQFYERRDIVVERPTDYARRSREELSQHFVPLKPSVTAADI